MFKVCLFKEEHIIISYGKIDEYVKNLCKYFFYNFLHIGPWTLNSENIL
jgi:hypothetical protein